MALTISVLNTIVAIGDMVRISQKIKEGEKERIQNFEGMVIAIKGNQGERTITVRRIGAAAVGIEKIIPIDLPSLSKIEVIKHGKTRRSKLYFLRERTGKAALQLPDTKPSDEQQAKPSSRKPRGAKSARVSRAKKAVSLH